MTYLDSERCTLLFIAAGLLLLSSCATVPPEILLAEEMVQKENWDGAVAAYREALRKDPFNDELEAKYQDMKLRAAQFHYKQGRSFLKAKQLPQALEEFQIALGLDPLKTEHHMALEDAVRLKEARASLLDAENLRKFGRLDDAMAAYELAIELDPSLTEAVEGLTSLVQDQTSRTQLGGSTEPVTLRFQNTRLKQVFEILARTAGINILFEKDVRDDLVTIFTKDTPFREALNLILTTNQLFSRQVAKNTLLIIPDTKQKRGQYQDLQIRTFYLSNAKAKDIANLLRTILETKRVYVNEPLNTVVIRAQPEKMQLAEQIIIANDRRDAEVVFNVEVLEVNRNKRKRLGANFAKQIGAGFFPLDSNGAISGTLGAASSFTMKQLGSLGPESYLFTFPSSILLEFFKTESDAKTLANPKLRVLNNQKASINIGDKQPILLSTTNVNPGTNPQSGTVATSTVTSIEFKDTGIKLNVEPTIHLTGEITIKLKIEVTRLGQEVTLQDNPPIKQFRFGNRTAETTLNIKDGETVVLAGLIQEENRQTRDSVPGIDDVPIIEDLFFKQTEKVTTEVMLVITPRLVRAVAPPNIIQQTLWSGTANQYALHPLFSEREPASIQGMQEADVPSDLPLSPPSQVSQANGGAPSGSPLSSGPAPSEGPLTPARVFLSPSALSAKAGATIRLTLMAENLPLSGSSQLSFNYDPGMMTFIQALAPEGGPRGGKAPGHTVSASAVPGKGQLVLQFKRPPGSPLANGPLAILEFTAKKAGKSSLVIRPPRILAPTGKPVPITAQYGQIQIQ